MHLLIIGGILLSVMSGWMILWKVRIIPRKLQEKPNMKNVSIIIPARNEEDNLPILLKSLENQHVKPFEILVVDDSSEDNTAKVAKALGAKIIQFHSDEIGWVGKSAACFAGAKVAKGEWIFFLDADVFLPNEDSLANILTEFEKLGGRGILSIQPYHVIQSFYENLSAIFNIIVLAGMNGFSIFKEQLKPAGAFGPSLLIDRNLYFKMGGHQRVKDSIMENIDFGNYLVKQNLPVHLYGGIGSLHFRMYPYGIRNLSEGWSKSFATASKSTHLIIIIGTSLWISGAFLSFAYLVGGWFLGNVNYLLLALVSYVLYYLQFYRMANIAGNFHGWALFFYPIYFFYFVGLFVWSGIKTFIFRSVSWKGRKVEL